MQTKVNYTLVGLFVVLLTLVIVMMILWLSRAGSNKNYVIYAVYMREAVSGLNVQAPVKFNGVKVGEVKEISLDHRDLQTVRLLLNIEDDIPITEGTRATRLAQGITGITYIGLSIEKPNTPLLKVKVGDRYPVIKSSPSLLLQLDTFIKDVGTSVKTLTDNLNQVFNKENKVLLRENLRNIEQFTLTLAKNSQRMDIIIRDSERLSQQLTMILQEISSQTLPNATTISRQVTSVLRNLEQLTSEIKRHPSILIRDKQPLPPGPGE